MAASAKTITLDSANIFSDWTVVLPRRVQTPHMLEAFFRVLGSELKMQMLSLAILLKRKVQLDWGHRGIGSNSFSDRIRVLEALGCSVLSVNEQGSATSFKANTVLSCHTHASELGAQLMLFLEAYLGSGISSALLLKSFAVHKED
ncbi:hypothetical protein CK203_112000 [Vitis vinifera]|uniref:Uncharacterized protein n=1 Tax=Vitis vinifera TaxID=29760 RepID=A0A438CU26_VITVI|nr:hypothetical protein CK203_112000 [Vitis vinifera]